MQTLANTSFGTLWVFIQQLGDIDARGMIIRPVLSTDNEDNAPFSLVFFPTYN